eukprot:1186324-Prorocentrum_minimum.AAC.1
MVTIPNGHHKEQPWYSLDELVMTVMEVMQGGWAIMCRSSMPNCRASGGRLTRDRAVPSSPSSRNV